ncbi:hypothetical protein K5V07_01850 [Flavobacterium sp. CHNK8]|uniref:hypothetical protein n=1 Tax=Flavobacterium sp. CHNK8 TaxID=2871165 RepID=UPI001C8E950E|nr:hypothetical protein [Flavobacterium sp. CHNK8]QZK89300.1 hypothetical protein K5V07_01850 [Flavobacterium sp. CHNK8]
MTDIQTILTSKFPKTEERVEGRLVFLDQHEIIRLDSPRLQAITKLDFYKTKFFTGYRKFTIIDTVVGLSNDNEVFLLTNPLFSDKYSDLIKIFENVKSAHVDKGFVSDLVDMYRATGAKITEIGADKYQIWFSDNKWRILDFEINGTLKIKTTLNSTLPKGGVLGGKNFSAPNKL